MAASVVPLVAAPGAVLFDDCSNVVRDFMADPKEWVKEGKAYAGLMKMAKEYNAGGNLEQVLKVKGHVDRFDPSLTHEERLRACGNYWADLHADEAEKLHPEVPRLKEYLERIKTAEKVLDLIGNMLPLWPRCEHQYERPTGSAQKGRKRIPSEEKHKWVHDGNLSTWLHRWCRW